MLGKHGASRIASILEVDCGRESGIVRPKPDKRNRLCVQVLAPPEKWNSFNVLAFDRSIILVPKPGGRDMDCPVSG